MLRSIPPIHLKTRKSSSTMEGLFSLLSSLGCMLHGILTRMSSWQLLNKNKDQTAICRALGQLEDTSTITDLSLIHDLVIALY